jgi:hypothetical protein
MQAIATKFRRALRNGTGASFTIEQLKELIGHGVLELIAQIEVQELCHTKPAHTLSKTVGLISGVTVRRPTSGKLPRPANDQSFIVAPTARGYATKAKFDHALHMARLAGIEEVGSVKLSPDGAIQIDRPIKPVSGEASVKDEIEEWRKKRAGR